MVRFQEFTEAVLESKAIEDAVRGNPGDWAVLSRTNRILDVIEGYLTANGVPCTRMGGASLWSNPAVERYISALESLEGRHTRGLENLVAWGDENETVLRHLHGSLCNMSFEFIKGALAKNLCLNTRRLQKSWGDWRKDIRQDRVKDPIRGVVEWMAAASPKKKGDIRMAEIAADILCSMSEELSLKDRLKKVRGMAMFKASSDKAEDNKGEVMLCTLHSSKGLQWPNVWMPAMHQGVIPSDKAESLDEERRLCYVGITRAENNLVMSHHNPEAVSQFLREGFPDHFSPQDVEGDTDESNLIQRAS